MSQENKNMTESNFINQSFLGHFKARNPGLEMDNTLAESEFEELETHSDIELLKTSYLNVSKAFSEIKSKEEMHKFHKDTMDNLQNELETIKISATKSIIEKIRAIEPLFSQISIDEHFDNMKKKFENVSGYVNTTNCQKALETIRSTINKENQRITLLKSNIFKRGKVSKKQIDAIVYDINSPENKDGIEKFNTIYKLLTEVKAVELKFMNDANKTESLAIKLGDTLKRFKVYVEEMETFLIEVLIPECLRRRASIFICDEVARFTKNYLAREDKLREKFLQQFELGNYPKVFGEMLKDCNYYSSDDFISTNETAVEAQKDIKEFNNTLKDIFKTWEDSYKTLTNNSNISLVRVEAQQLKDRVAELEKNLEESKQETKNTEAELQNERNKFQDCLDKFNTTKCEVDSEKDKSENLKSINTSLERVKLMLEAEVQDLQKRLADSQKKSKEIEESLNKKIEEKDTKIKHLEIDQKSNREIFAKQKSDINNLTKKDHENTESLKTALAQNGEYEKEVKELREKYSKTYEENDYLSTMNKKLRDDLSKLQSK